jgi:hypothetical protein
VIYVSYWIGVVTLLATGLFSLEALYLVNDWPKDIAYIWANNLLWLALPLVFFTSGIFNFLRQRRAKARPVGAATTAPAVG